MRKALAAALALALIWVSPLPGAAESTPQVETGIVQADHIPAIRRFLSIGDQVLVTGEPEEGMVAVETEYGEGTLELALLRFPGEAVYQARVGVTRPGARLFDEYTLGGKPRELEQSIQVEVLEELEDCYMVTLKEPFPTEPDEEEENSYYFLPRQELYTQPESHSQAPTRDGGDIVLSPMSLTQEQEKLGPAQVRIDGAMLLIRELHRGEQVQLLTEPDEEREQEGYLLLQTDDDCAYVPQGWVLREGQTPMEPREGYALVQCRLYENHLLRGEEERTLPLNTRLTVLWDDGLVSLVALPQQEEPLGFVASDSLGSAPLPTQQPTEPPTQQPTEPTPTEGGPVWTPPKL